MGVSEDFHIDLRRRIDDCEDVEQCMIKYLGSIRNDDTGAEMGRLTAFVIDADRSAFHCGQTVTYVLDMHSATAPYCDLFWQSLGEEQYSPAVLRMLCDPFIETMNLLIVDRLELLPKYRGRGLGLAALSRTIEGLRLGCRIAAIKPFPLQHESARPDDAAWAKRMRPDTFAGTLDDGRKGLARYYRKAGFRAVRGTPLMIRDLAY
jgi:hypothetical protein